MKLVYLGTPEMAVPPLRALVAAGHEVVLVVTRADKRRGRGQRTHAEPGEGGGARARSPGVPHRRRPRRAGDDRSGVELGVVVAFGQIIKPHVLAVLPFVNLHFSLLPRWRGAAPVERALLAGDERDRRLRDAARGGARHRRRVRQPNRADRRHDDRRRAARDVGRGRLGAARRHVGRPLGTGSASAGPQQGEPTYAAKFAAADFEIDWARAGRRHPPTDPSRRCVDDVPVEAAEDQRGRSRRRSDRADRRCNRRARRRCRSMRGATAPARCRANCSATCERAAEQRRSPRFPPGGPRRVAHGSRTTAPTPTSRSGRRCTHSGLGELDRKFVTELVYGTTRMRRACDALVDRFLTSPPDAVDPDRAAPRRVSGRVRRRAAARGGRRDRRACRRSGRAAW